MYLNQEIKIKVWWLLLWLFLVIVTSIVGMFTGYNLHEQSFFYYLEGKAYDGGECANKAFILEANTGVSLSNNLKVRDCQEIEWLWSKAYEA